MRLCTKSYFFKNPNITTLNEKASDQTITKRIFLEDKFDVWNDNSFFLWMTLNEEFFDQSIVHQSSSEMYSFSYIVEIMICYDSMSRLWITKLSLIIDLPDTKHVPFAFIHDKKNIRSFTKNQWRHKNYLHLLTNFSFFSNWTLLFTSYLICSCNKTVLSLKMNKREKIIGLMNLPDIIIHPIL